jgi:hypothetical protein
VRIIDTEKKGRERKMREKISVMNKSFLNDLNSMQLYFSFYISFRVPYFVFRLFS